MKTFFYIFLVLLFFLINNIPQGEAAFNIIQITNNVSNDTLSLISEGKITWQANSSPINRGNIVLYKNNSIIELSTTTIDALLGFEKDYILWDRFGTNGGLFLFNGTSTTKISNNFSESFPAVLSRGQVVWRGLYDGILFFDGSDTHYIYNFCCNARFPDVYDGMVVWEQSYSSQILLWDGQSIRNISFSGEVHPNYNPQIYDGRVVWSGYSYESNNFEIFYFDGQITRQITNNEYDDISPKIYGDEIVWSGFDGSDYEIFLFNAINRSLRRITDNNYHDGAPEIYHGKIAWQAEPRRPIQQIFFFDGLKIFQLTNHQNYSSFAPKLDDTGVVWYGWDGQDYEIFFYPTPQAEGVSLLLLPGIMGSWTRDYDQLLEHSNAPRPQDMVFIEDQRAFIQEPFYGRLNWFIPNTWEALRNSLTATSTGYRYGDNLFDAPYDWRTSNDFNRDAEGSIDISQTYIRYPGSGWDSDENIARIDTAPEYLMYWIDQAKSASRSDKVDIVAHSMGGLVARAYIQSPLYQSDIRKLAIVGTPNHGAADSYFLWAGGDSKLGQDFGTGLFLSSWFNQMKAHFGQSLTDVGFTHRFFKSVGQLLPVAGFSHEDNNNNRVLDQGEDLNGNNQLDAFPGYLLRTDLVPRSGLFPALTFYSRITTVNQNRFLEVLNTTASAIREKGVDFKIFLGAHLSTAKFARILADSNTTDDRWLDGEPNSPETFSPHEGDERTLISSGSMPELDASSTQLIIRNDFDHAYLPSHFRTEIVDFLRATISPPGIPLAEEIKATRALSMYVASPVDVLLIDPQGRRVGFDQMTGQEYRDVPMSWYTGNVKNEHIIIPDPILETYQVILQGNGDGVFTSWATLVCDEKVHESVEKKTVGTVASGTILRFDLLINEGCGVDAFEYGIPATIDIEPRTLNASSQGNFVTAQISFSSPYTISDIDFSTVMLNNSVSLSPSFISPRSGGADRVVVKFDRGVVVKTLSLGEHTIFISGDLLNGTHFFGTTTLRVLDAKQSWFDSYLILALLGFAGIRIVGLLVKVLV